jgi:hypothetical protein
MRKSVLSLILATTLAGAHAQEELSAPFLKGAWAAYQANPAALPEGRIAVGLPTFYNNIYISSVTYNDLFGHDTQGLPFIDVDRAINRLSTENTIRENLQWGTLGVAFNFDAWSFSIQHGIRHNAYLRYPKTLAQLIWQGNAQFIGQEVAVGPDTHLFSYHELALGAAWRLGAKATLGARVKGLSGIADVSTPRHSLHLTTDEEAYALSLRSDLLVNNAGAISYEGFESLSLDFHFGRFDASRLTRRNYGYAFDVGLAVVTGRFHWGLSALDLGRIQWRDNVENYTLEGVRTFSGLDISASFFNDSIRFGSLLDTLAEAFDVEKGFAPYSVDLPARVYFSGEYLIDAKWRAGAVFYLEPYRGRQFTAAAVSANFRAFPFLDLGMVYAWRHGTFDHVGMNASIYVGPVHGVIATDNLFSALQIKDSHSANLRIGLGLALY